MCWISPGVGNILVFLVYVTVQGQNTNPEAIVYISIASVQCCFNYTDGVKKRYNRILSGLI